MRWSRRRWRWTLFNNQFSIVMYIGNMKKMLTIRTRMLNSDERLPSSRRSFAVNSIWRAMVFGSDNVPKRPFLGWALKRWIRSAVSLVVPQIRGRDSEGRDWVRSLTAFTSVKNANCIMSIEDQSNDLETTVCNDENEASMKTSHACF